MHHAKINEKSKKGKKSSPHGKSPRLIPSWKETNLKSLNSSLQLRLNFPKLALSNLTATAGSITRLGLALIKGTSDTSDNGSDSLLVTVVLITVREQFIRSSVLGESLSVTLHLQESSLRSAKSGALAVVGVADHFEEFWVDRVDSTSDVEFLLGVGDGFSVTLGFGAGDARGTAEAHLSSTETGLGLGVSVTLALGAGDTCGSAEPHLATAETGLGVGCGVRITSDAAGAGDTSGSTESHLAATETGLGVGVGESVTLSLGAGDTCWTAESHLTATESLGVSLAGVDAGDGLLDGGTDFQDGAAGLVAGGTIGTAETALAGLGVGEGRGDGLGGSLHACAGGAGDTAGCDITGAGDTCWTAEAHFATAEAGVGDWVGDGDGVGEGRANDEEGGECDLHGCVGRVVWLVGFKGVVDSSGEGFVG